MVKKITPQKPKRVPGIPIKPTEKPSPQEALRVTHMVLEIVQKAILNPAAVISVLKAAEDAYVSNARDKGMPDDVIENCQVLGMTLSNVMQKMFADQDEPSKILTRDTGIVGPDGSPVMADVRPMTASESNSEKAPEAYQEATKGAAPDDD